MSDIDKLIKNWEDRNDVSEEVETPKQDSEKEEEDSSPFDNALMHNDVPVALVKSDGVDYICCMVEESYVSCPLMIGEIRSPGSLEETGEQLQIGMSKVYASLDVMEGVYMHTSFVYLLNKNKESDKKMYDLYVNVLNKLKIDESVIISPTSEDLVKINSGK